MFVLSGSLIIPGCDLSKTNTENTPQETKKENISKSDTVTVEDMRQELAKNILNFKETNYEDETTGYIIQVKYPEIKYSDPKFEKFGNAINVKISAHIKDKIDYFISEVENWGSTPEDIEMTTKSGLYTSYEISMLNPKLISIKFDNSMYHAGAAHPDTYTTVLNYDVENDKELIIENIFKNDSGWEQALSDNVVPRLNERIKTDFEFDDLPWIKEGAGPKAENFTVFTLSQNGINFTWDPYLLAPYAAGPQSITVQYSEIENFFQINIADYLQN